MAKEKFKFPDETTLKSMRKKLEKAKGSYILPADADAIDRAKYEMCRQILIYMHRKGLSQRDLAKRMGIAETRVSEIVHYRIWKFTLDRLLGYLEKINPKVVLKVA
jgi:predicted XRE-type DNA-binding protein